MPPVVIPTPLHPTTIVFNTMITDLDSKMRHRKN